MTICQCVHPSPTMCLVNRYKISKSLASCLGNCQCPCHRSENGGLIPRGQWHINQRVRASSQERGKSA